MSHCFFHFRAEVVALKVAAAARVAANAVAG
jgi:hypothetical protein